MATGELSLEERVRRLEDRDEIWGLITDFRRCVDTGDFAGFAALFAEDGELLTNLGPPAKGPAEIEALLERTLERSQEAQRTFHHVTNSKIDVDGDRATAASNWSFVQRNDEGGPVMVFAGHYDDVFTRESGEWKFLRRAVYMDMPFNPFDREADPAGVGDAT